MDRGGKYQRAIRWIALWTYVAPWPALFLACYSHTNMTFPDVSYLS